MEEPDMSGYHCKPTNQLKSMTCGCLTDAAHVLSLSQAERVMNASVYLFYLYSKFNISSTKPCWTQAVFHCWEMHGGSWQRSTGPRVCGGSQPRQGQQRCCGQDQEWLHSRGVQRGVAPGMAPEVRQARTHEVQGGVEEQHVCWQNAQVLAPCPENDKRGNQERTYRMTFLPGKPNYGSCVGCGDTLLVQGEGGSNSEG